MGGKSKAQTIGYKYYIGMHSVLCHGPIDNIQKVTVDDRLAWQGTATGGSIVINAESLFGGESREGGVSGTIDVAMGAPAQTRNSYLVAKLGATVPAYRGVVSMIFRQCYMGNNPYLKPWRFRGQRIHTRQNGIAQWNDSQAEIPANPSASIDLAAEFPVLTKGVDPGYPNPGQFYPKTVTIGPFLSDALVKAGTPDGGGFARPDDFLFLNGVQYGSVAGTSFPGGTLFYTLIAGNTLTVQVKNTIDSFSGITGNLSVGFPSRADMNGAHIIRECLTDPDWGMGYLDSDIDEPSFLAAASTLKNESLGISLLWDKQILVDAFIQEIIKHIDAALYVSRTTGKFVLKLIRADYDEDALLTLDESNIARIEDPSRPSFGELTNSVTVNYWDGETGKDASLTVTDTAMALVQGSTINTPVQYPGFTTARNASIAGQRDLRALSSPLLNCTIYVDSAAEDLNVGDVFKLNWSKWGIYQLVMRITSFALGNGRTNQIKLTCVQDIFDTNTETVVANPPADWEDPSKPPAPAVDSLGIEAPYLELVQNLGQANVDDALTNKPDSGYVLGAAPRPSGAINARMWIDNGDGTGYNSISTMEFCPYCELVAPVGKLDTLVYTTGGTDMDQVTVGQHGQLGDEIVRIDAVDTVANTVTIGRGCLDTVPQIHDTGTSFFLWDLDNSSDPTEYVTGEVVDVKIQPVSGAGAVDLSLVSEREVTLDGRAWRPYAPGDFRINGDSYEPIDYSGELTITWTHRNRLEQTGGTIVDHTAGDIGPEPDTLYRLQGYADDVLFYTEDDIAGTTTSWTPATDGATVRVEVHAKRDGVYSWMAPNHTFLYSNGGIRITEDTDVRLTEEGNLRTLEV